MSATQNATKVLDGDIVGGLTGACIDDAIIALHCVEKGLAVFEESGQTTLTLTLTELRMIRVAVLVEAIEYESSL